jgi:Bacterial extracellular solute-binding proteins, family 5 Middle
MAHAVRPLIVLAAFVSLLSGAVPSDVVEAQERPRYGGELIFVLPSEMPSYDGHREGTFGTVHPLAPFYNTLLRIDPTDRTGTRPVGDLAESWTISADAMTYTFKLRQGIRFHDGSPLSSRDVKASYDKIIFPPAGVSPLHLHAAVAPHRPPQRQVQGLDNHAVSLPQSAARRRLAGRVGEGLARPSPGSARRLQPRAVAMSLRTACTGVGSSSGSIGISMMAGRLASSAVRTTSPTWSGWST